MRFIPSRFELLRQSVNLSNLVDASGLIYFEMMFLLFKELEIRTGQRMVSSPDANIYSFEISFSFVFELLYYDGSLLVQKECIKVDS